MVATSSAARSELPSSRRGNPPLGAGEEGNPPRTSTEHGCGGEVYRMPVASPTLNITWFPQALRRFPEGLGVATPAAPRILPNQSRIARPSTNFFREPAEGLGFSIVAEWRRPPDTPERPGNRSPEELPPSCPQSFIPYFHRTLANPPAKVCRKSQGPTGPRPNSHCRYRSSETAVQLSPGPSMVPGVQAVYLESRFQSRDNHPVQ